jgi:predicted RecA/RadA family phage recombinase
MSSPEAAFVINAGQADYTPTSAKTAGEVVQWDDGRAAVVKAGLAASEKGAVYLSGIFDVTCAAATTFAVGDPVYWDDSAGKAVGPETANASADLYMGIAMVACGSSDTTVRVDLNVAPGMGLGRSAWTSRVVTIEHDDTDEHTVINAEDNPEGLLLIGILGEVTEQPAGSSEDQLIITLYDEDDNAIDTLTTTDTTPDAAGDIIVGAVSVFSSASGSVAKTIPAGKAAYFKVSQATAGTPAGALRCRAIVCPLQ